MPQFVSSKLGYVIQQFRPAVDYHMWGWMHIAECIYCMTVITWKACETWANLPQSIVDEATDKWQARLHPRVKGETSSAKTLTLRLFRFATQLALLKAQKLLVS